MPSSTRTICPTITRDMSQPFWRDTMGLWHGFVAPERDRQVMP